MVRRVFTDVNDFFEQNNQLNTKINFSEHVSLLAEKVSVGAKVVHNRLACQAMEGCDGTADGSPAELTFRRYRRFAKGGAGIIWFEATACCESARANPRQLWLHNNNLDAFKYIVEDIRETAIKANGYTPIIIMQATHSGRYSKPQGVPASLIAYNNPLFEGNNTIDKKQILSDDEIDTVKEQLIALAQLAEKVGFDGVDIKCCHRYLCSELLSAFNRPGKYGGSLENRTRLIRESISGAKKVCTSNFIVSSRLNVYDGFPYPYGFGVSEDGSLAFNSKEPIWLLKELEKIGVELLNISMGNPYVNPHVNRPFSMGGYKPEEHPLEGVSRLLNGIAEIKQAIPGIKLISSGLSYLGVAAPNVAAAYIKNNDFDFAGFGRTIFAYPDFAKDILTYGEMKKEKICIGCSKCSEMMRGGSTPGCVIRDKLYTDLYKVFKVGK